MRMAAILSLLAILSAPLVPQEPLSPQEVDRFLAAAEQIRKADSDGQPLARTLTAATHAGIPEAHGFTERRWRSVVQRVLTAYQVDRIVVVPPGASEAGTQRPVSLPPEAGTASPERLARQAIANITRGDIAALVAETESDRAVIAAFRDRLDRLIAP